MTCGIIAQQRKIAIIIFYPLVNACDFSYSKEASHWPSH